MRGQRVRRRSTRRRAGAAEQRDRAIDRAGVEQAVAERAARRLATVDLPAPAGPSIVTTIDRGAVLGVGRDASIEDGCIPRQRPGDRR